MYLAIPKDTQKHIILSEKELNPTKKNLIKRLWKKNLRNQI